MHWEQSPSNVGAETLNQRKEKERCRQDRREKKGLESGGRYRMGSLEDPCVPQAQGPGKQWKDKAFKEGTPGLRRDHFLLPGSLGFLC